MKKCLIVINTYKAESGRLGQDVACFLEERGIECSFLEFNGFSEEYPFDGYDFVVTLGGDGTVLYACRGCASRSIPVFPINLGEFGFIAGVNRNAWMNEMIDFLEKDCEYGRRLMMEACVFRNGNKINSFVALNDVVVSAKTAVTSIALDLMLKGAPLGQFRADGIIIATSTGSTAYSASAGGPIIDPDLDAIVLTPLNSFSLSVRPLVFSGESELCVKVMHSRAQAVITCDGQKPVDLEEGDEIKITKAPYKAILAGSSVVKFFNALRFKLNWSGEPHA